MITLAIGLAILSIFLSIFAIWLITTTEDEF